jgi:hypothetical protein
MATVCMSLVTLIGMGAAVGAGLRRQAAAV